ncbi:hypothetical protein FACS1894201_02810 [Bacteroidia bacterium]|nr:hypothetical protein FACS1894201_02810 [Bacteroidia bacterium]
MPPSNHKNTYLELENKINVLSIGGSMIAAGKDSTKAKLAINEMVRNIDKCIQLLDG